MMDARSLDVDTATETALLTDIVCVLINPYSAQFQAVPR